MVRNSEFVLKTLDSVLTRTLPFRLHLLGGAALDLVYNIPRFSEDVDVMCSMAEGSLWETPEVTGALDRANKKLEVYNLYITHIFDENSLVHTEDWSDRLVSAPNESPSFRYFQYDAVSPEDIIISKLTRFDEKDKLDIVALMAACNITKVSISKLFDCVIVPEVWNESWEKGIEKWLAWDPNNRGI